MTFANHLALRIFQALRSRPWIRAVVGAVLVAVGMLELLIGVGHGRKLESGLLLIAGSATAARSRRTGPPKAGAADAGSHRRRGLRRR